MRDAHVQDVHEENELERFTSFIKIFPTFEHFFRLPIKIAKVSAEFKLYESFWKVEKVFEKGLPRIRSERNFHHRLLFGVKVM